MPVDIPKFPISDLSFKTEAKWKSWNFAKLTENDNTPYGVSTLKESLDPRLIEWFTEFPYTTIRNIKFNIQENAVKPHIDFTDPNKDLNLFTNNIKSEPCGYRILLCGSRSGSLYVMHKGKKIYVTMPEDTDVYVLGHTNTLHGVDDEPGRVTIFTHFEIDIERHKQIIERSLSKYKDYAVIV